MDSNIPNVLEVVCSKCRVADHCPSKGSSPLNHQGKRIAHCRLIGGYGREPIADKFLSEESKKLVEEHGPCLTIAEVPTIDEGSGKFYYKVTKIFSEPITHPREKISPKINRMMLYPSGYRADRK